MTQFFDLFVPPASVRSSLAFNLAQTVPKPPAIVRTVCFILGACSVYGWWWPNVPGRPSENFGPMFSVVRFWRGTFRTTVLVFPSLSRYAIFFNQSSSTGKACRLFSSVVFCAVHRDTHKGWGQQVGSCDLFMCLWSFARPVLNRLTVDCSSILPRTTLARERVVSGHHNKTINKFVHTHRRSCWCMFIKFKLHCYSREE